MSETRVEYAVLLDCAANGCETPHSDDGMVVPHVYDGEPLPTEINRHRVTPVRRTVTTTEWEPA